MSARHLLLGYRGIFFKAEKKSTCRIVVDFKCMEVSKRAVKNMQEKRDVRRKKAISLTAIVLFIIIVLLFIIIRVYQGLVERKEIKEKPEKE